MVTAPANSQPVLFLCDRNCTRSPMAETMLKAWRGPNGAPVTSAGIAPFEEVDPFAVAVLKEWGLDASKHAPRGLEAVSLPDHTLVIALTPACYSFAHEWRAESEFDLEFWNLPEPPSHDQPRETIMETYRAMRAALKKHITSHFPLENR